MIDELDPLRTLQDSLAVSITYNPTEAELIALATSLDTSRASLPLLALLIKENNGLVEEFIKTNTATSLELLAYSMMIAPSYVQIFNAESTQDCLLKTNDKTRNHILSVAAGDPSSTSGISKWIDYMIENRSAHHMLIALVRLHFSQKTPLAGLPSQSDIFAWVCESKCIDEQLECLSFLTHDPIVAQKVVDEPQVLTSLLSTIPDFDSKAAKQLKCVDSSEKPKQTGFEYALSVVLLHLTQFPKSESETDALEKMAKLKLNEAQRQAKGQNPDLARREELKRSPAVLQRCSLLLELGAIDVLSRMLKNGALTNVVKTNIASCILSLATSTANRPAVIQQGGFRSLLQLGSIPQAQQALCKIVITTQPSLLFAPPYSHSCAPALAIVLQLFFGKDSSNLQKFEAIMALTNIASLSEKLAARIASREGLLLELENCFINQSTPLLQRSSVELLCNLIPSQASVLLQRYTTSASHLRLLLALTDAEDKATRLAAAGCLAQLFEFPSTLSTLSQADGGLPRVIKSVADAISEGEGMRHRGLAICICLLHHPIEKVNIEAEIVKIGLQNDLQAIAHSQESFKDLAQACLDELNR